MSIWIYFYGTDDGRYIKIGKTAGVLGERRREIETGQLSDVHLHLLAAVRTAHPKTEKDLHTAFASAKAHVNSTETFDPALELVEYINWLRQQWWTALGEAERPDDVPHPSQWLPDGDARRVALQEPDPDVLLQTFEAVGPLADTPWARLSTPNLIGNEYYTPTDLVDAARAAMGGIDLDPASNWLANRVHKIPKYYHLGRRAEDNTWEGRVWLNPPYGDNAPWFDQILKWWDFGAVTQLCMLSPVWVFQAKQARPVVARASVLMLLSPTPTFWGHGSRTGTNHPHGILYLGDRVHECVKAFSDFGIPMRILDESELGKATRPLLTAAP